MKELSCFADKYYKNLTESIIPFWQGHSLDTQYGGYFTCLERNGSIYDTKKYIWLQGRAIWMFSQLYNELEKKQEFLDAAKLGIDFIDKYAFDNKGRPYFCLTREGKPYFFQRKPYGAVFCMLGYLEYARATGQQQYHRKAEELFARISAWIEDTRLLDRPVLSGLPQCSNLANVMVLASMAIELAKFDRKPEYIDLIQQTIKNTQLHYDCNRRILIENVSLDDTSLESSPEGRLFNPGHSIEVAWFLLHLLEFIPDKKMEKLALDALEGSLEYHAESYFHRNIQSDYCVHAHRTLGCRT